jgi:two-component system, OmpR family, alkaline phosphatase synthesis response regulator PhoP
MEKKGILIVDDEKNIRLTLSHALQPLELPVHTAGDGEEALKKLQEHNLGLVLLDLKMPGMDGLEVLRRIKDTWPKTQVILITAHGTIESAVEAMKLGAVDFIRKPFGPKEIRDLAAQVLERQVLNGEKSLDYETLIGTAGGHISERRFDEARGIIRKAIAFDPRRPEAFNLFGALLEIKHDRLEAQRFYRAALDIDPTYRPARINLNRTTSRQKFGEIDLGQKPNELLES